MSNYSSSICSTFSPLTKAIYVHIQVGLFLGSLFCSIRPMDLCSQQDSCFSKEQRSNEWGSWHKTSCSKEELLNKRGEAKRHDTVTYVKGRNFKKTDM